MKFGAAFFLGILLLIGCNYSNQPNGDFPNVEFSTVARSSHIVQDQGFDRRSPELALLNSFSDAQNFLQRKLVGQWLLDSLRTIDYKTSSVILLHLEWQATGMIEVEIDSLKYGAGTIQVYATRILPRPGPVTTDIGFPCHIVVTPRLVGAIEISLLGSRTRS